MVFEKLSGILLGFPFFDKKEITIYAHKNYLHFPDFTFQLNLMQTGSWKTSKRFNNNRKVYLKTTTRVIIKPVEPKLIELMPYQPLEADHQIGIEEPTTKLENKGVCLTKTIDEMLQDKPIQLKAFKTTQVPITIKRNTLPATFTKITPEQARYLIPLEPKLLETNNLRNTTKIISKHIHKVAKGQLNHITINHTAKYWFPTPETTQDPSKLTGLEI